MVGMVLGNRYELLEKIGVGGMAEVYKAKCHKLDRFVAVKILKKEFNNDEEFVQRFKNEARAVGSLSHNNIVNIFDVGTENNINYIVMEYIDGKTLKELIIEDEKLNFNASVIIAIQIAKALDCAHSKNIIHRDIKPQNIIITKEGVVKVTDFGIAKAANSATLVNTNRIVGSAHYLSPEQAKGCIVDAKSDIYSLGIVLYEMLTGEVPFKADSPVVVALKHIQENVVPPNEINGDIPESLNKLVLKAMEKDTSKRYQSAKDLLNDLQRIKNNYNCNIITNDYDSNTTRIMEPIKIDSSVNNKEKDKKNKRRIFILVVILALIIIVGAGVGSIAVKYFYNRSSNLTQVTVPNIIGMTEEQAKTTLGRYNLKLVVSGKEESDSAKDTIIRCYPEEGSTVKPNREISVFISSGPEKIEVPNLLAMDLDTAKFILSTNELQIGTIEYEYSDNETNNTIIKQDPESESLLDKGGRVDVVVSRGPEIILVKVPNLIGKKLADAETLLLAQNLKLGEKTPVYTSDKELKSLDGTIKIQSIQANTEIKEGETINISYYVYNEPKIETTKVPDFINLTVEAAQEIADENRLKVEFEGNYEEDYIITSQSIKSGEIVEIETIIKLKAEKVEQKNSNE